MTELENYLFDEFKRLDAICCDMFSCQHGISAYITQMERTPAYLQCQIPGWDKDYRSLKRLRWLRNQIAHQISATDCNISDVEQLEYFYERILSQKDPLAMLGTIERKVQKSSPQKHSVAPKSVPLPSNEDRQYPPRSAGKYLIIFGSVVLIIVLTVYHLFFHFLK